MDKIIIPEDIVKICTEFGKTAQALGLSKFTGSFIPGFEHRPLPGGWSGTVSISWEAGRHGEDSHLVSISVQSYLNTKITISKDNG